VVQKRPTEVGDTLILRTSRAYTVYVVGLVATAGQHDFSHRQQVRHVTTEAEAVKAAKATVAPHGKIYLRDIDSGEWSEISR
jgi:ribosomal protein S3AE